MVELPSLPWPRISICALSADCNAMATEESNIIMTSSWVWGPGGAVLACRSNHVSKNALRCNQNNKLHVQPIASNNARHCACVSRTNCDASEPIEEVARQPRRRLDAMLSTCRPVFAQAARSLRFLVRDAKDGFPFVRWPTLEDDALLVPGTPRNFFLDDSVTIARSSASSKSRVRLLLMAALALFSCWAGSSSSTW